MTKGYELPAKYIIHTVGPVWRDGRHGEPSYWHPVIDVALKLQPIMILLQLHFPRSAPASTDIRQRKRPEVAVAAARILSSGQLLCARSSSAAFLIVTMQSMRSCFRGPRNSGA